MQHDDLNIPLRSYLLIGNELETAVREQLTPKDFEALCYTLVRKLHLITTNTLPTVLKFELHAVLSRKS